MNSTQIKQVIGQLQSSIDKIESKLTIEEFREYCDSIAVAITYWQVELKKLKDNG